MNLSSIPKNRLTRNTQAARVHWLQPLTKSPHGSPRITAKQIIFITTEKMNLYFTKSERQLNYDWCLYYYYCASTYDLMFRIKK